MNRKIKKNITKAPKFLTQNGLPQLLRQGFHTLPFETQHPQSSKQKPPGKAPTRKLT